MNLYDEQIKRIKQIITAGGECKRLSGDGGWSVTDKEQLVLRGDMAYELGGSMNPAVSAMAYTTSQDFVKDDGVFLTGQDLSQIKGDTAYARITFIRFRSDLVNDADEQKMYALMKALEYVRFNLYVEGFMMRISSSREREAVRVSKAALEKGISFADVGAEFIKAYKKHPEVEDVQIYYVTLDTIDYLELGKSARICGRITDSLDHIFNGLVMDCSTCGSRELCDTIDGLRALHKKHS